MPWAGERIARSGLWQGFVGLPPYTWPPVVLDCPLTSPPGLASGLPDTHLPLLCSPALAGSPNALDVLAPHGSAPSEGFPLLTHMLILHPRRGYGVGGELASEGAFFNPDGRGASFSQ